MSSATQSMTSVVGEASEITAPVRIEGQSNSDVILTWLSVNRYLWMLTPPYDDHLERIVGVGARLRLGLKLIEWKKDPRHGEGHEALAVPADEESRRAAFGRLEKLIKHHFFDSGGSKSG